MLWMWSAVCFALRATAADRESTDPKTADLTKPVDLTKIDRSVAKEPEYSNSPRYCLLVFGEKAESRVWIERINLAHEIGVRHFQIS
ncbi:MAG: hypothetical protein ACKV2Q_24645 [Planctomycetaceae bacterium]